MRVTKPVRTLSVKGKLSVLLSTWERWKQARLFDIPPFRLPWAELRKIDRAIDRLASGKPDALNAFSSTIEHKQRHLTDGSMPGMPQMRYVARRVGAVNVALIERYLSANASERRALDLPLIEARLAGNKVRTYLEKLDANSEVLHSITLVSDKARDRLQAGSIDAAKNAVKKDLLGDANPMVDELRSLMKTA